MCPNDKDAAIDFINKDTESVDWRLANALNPAQNLTIMGLLHGIDKIARQCTYVAYYSNQTQHA